jgi:hypothetical protein
MAVVGEQDHTASALAKEEEGKAAPVEHVAPVNGTLSSATETTETVDEKDTALTEAKEEAETQSSVTEQVKEKILEVAAPVTAAVAATGAAVGAAGAAVVGFMTGETTERETSPIPGSFPATPPVEKEESSTLSVVSEVQKSDDEPVPGVVVPITPATDTVPVLETSTTAENESATNNLETVALATGAGAVAAGGFAAHTSAKEHETAAIPPVEAPAENEFAKALAADKEVNTAPTGSHIPSASLMSDAPEKNSEFGILPIPSATAPEGAKPLAQSTYKDPETTAEVNNLVPEPVQEKIVPEVPESKNFEPVTSETNIIQSAETIPPVNTVGVIETPSVETATTDATSNAISKTAQLKDAALKSSEHAAHTAAQALNPEITTPAPIDPKSTLSSFIPGAGVTAIGTATDHESSETGLARMVARKTEENHVNVQTEAKAAVVDPAIELDETKLGKPAVESLGHGGAVAYTPVTVSVPTMDGVQNVTALGTAIVTDGEKGPEELKQELENSGKHLPEGALAHLTPKVNDTSPFTTTTEPKDPVSEPTIAPSTPSKQPTTPKDTPTKTPVTQSSAARKDRPVSGVPSETGSAKKKKGGFLRKLKKVFS